MLFLKMKEIYPEHFHCTNDSGTTEIAIIWKTEIIMYFLKIFALEQLPEIESFL